MKVRSVWYDHIGLLLFLLSSTCLLIRLRPPRPARRRLWCQPGFAACAAAVLGVVIKAMAVVISNHARLGGWGNFDIQVFWRHWPGSGPAVAGAWLALIVAGCWRAERSGIDRIDIETLLTANRDTINVDLIREEWAPFAGTEAERTAWLDAAIDRRVVRRE
jgi:hypothetical protein